MRISPRSRSCWAFSPAAWARLFEVREKQGLVYWVSAWQDTPRGTGMIFMGASTTPERCDKTYTTLLREVERLSEDIEQEELQRAIIGIVAHNETRGDTTRSYCGELANDLFQFGRPIPREEKLAKIRGVTIEGMKRYLAAYRADPRCVMTLGPRPLSRK
jgi:predicted Zn-dependent peptidase